MRVDAVLKQLLAAELCGMFEDSTQVEMSVALSASQGDVSLIRRGKLSGFSASRLLRFFAWRGYNIEVRLVEAPNRSAKAAAWPKVTVARIDRYGREVGRREELAH